MPDGFLSRAWNFATTPLLPEYSFDNDDDTTNTALDRVYNRAIRPLSTPIDIALLTAPYLKAAGGVAKIAATGRYSAGQDAIEKSLYSSLLSSPQTSIKAGMGSVSGALVGAGKLAAKGEFGNAARVVRGLLPDQYIPNAIKGFASNPTHGRVPPNALAGKGIINRMLELPTRFMNAVDRPAIEAMGAGGIPEAEARRLTLSGTPETDAGRKFLAFMEDMPWLKPIMPFPRVGVHMVEQSIGTKPRAIASGLLGLGAYEAADKVPDEYTPYASALAGPFALPVAAGLAAGHAKSAGKGVQSAILDEVRNNLPMPSFELPRGGAILAEFTPNLLRDIAKANDPYERDTRAQTLGPLRAKIPGLREDLPAKGRKRDVLGRSVAGREDSTLKRFFTSEPYRVDVTPNDVPELAELDRLGVKVKVPSYSKEISIQGKKIPLTPENSEEYQVEQREAIQPFLEAFEKSDLYQSLDDDQKKAVIQEALKRVLAANRKSAKSRALRRAVE